MRLEQEHQSGGNQRPDDRPDGIAGTMKAERLAPVARRDRLGQHRVSQRSPDTAAQPSCQPSNQHERPTRGRGE